MFREFTVYSLSIDNVIMKPCTSAKAFHGAVDITALGCGHCDYACCTCACYTILMMTYIVHVQVCRVCMLIGVIFHGLYMYIPTCHGLLPITGSSVVASNAYYFFTCLKHQFNIYNNKTSTYWIE